MGTAAKDDIRSHLRLLSSEIQQRLTRPLYFQVLQGDGGKLEIKQVEFLTVEEMAQFLRVEKRTVYFWKEKNMVPCYKAPGSRVVLFDLNEILDWIKGLNTGGDPE